VKDHPEDRRPIDADSAYHLLWLLRWMRERVRAADVKHYIEIIKWTRDAQDSTAARAEGDT
jgi:hypothetical protein